MTKSSSSPRAIRLLLVGLSSTLVFACAPDGGGDAAAPANRADTGARDAQATSVGVPDAADKPMVSEAGGDAPLDHAGRDGGADSGASSDSGPPPSMPQELPSALRAAGVLGLFPAPNSEGLCPDPPLRVRFSAPPALGTAGKLQVFDAAQPGRAVASLDMARAIVTVVIDGATLNVERRAYVDGNDAVFYLPPHALSYGQDYFVRVEAGVLSGPGNAAFMVSDDVTWRFRTSYTAPRDSSALKVELDGSGDFCSIQGAIDVTDGSREIAIGRGTFHEILRFRERDRLTLRGADRKATVISGTNNENLNPGTEKRALISIDRSSDIKLENLTIHNLTPQGGSQAEALRMQNCDRCVVRNADIISLQDTLLWSGRIYAYGCYIAGNVDFIWGTGAAYFDRCEIKTLGRKGYNVQARNGLGGYGYVFVDSKLTSEPGITGHWLGRVDSSVYPASHVAYINCEMGAHIDPVGWQVTGGGTRSLRFWEYQSRASSGALIDTSRRHPGSKQLSQQQAAMMRDPRVVLDGWTP